MFWTGEEVSRRRADNLDAGEEAEQAGARQHHRAAASRRRIKMAQLLVQQVLVAPVHC